MIPRVHRMEMPVRKPMSRRINPMTIMVSLVFR